MTEFPALTIFKCTVWSSKYVRAVGRPSPPSTSVHNFSSCKPRALPASEPALPSPPLASALVCVWASAELLHRRTKLQADFKERDATEAPPHCGTLRGPFLFRGRVTSHGVDGPQSVSPPSVEGRWLASTFSWLGCHCRDSGELSEVLLSVFQVYPRKRGRWVLQRLWFSAFGELTPFSGPLCHFVLLPACPGPAVPCPRRHITVGLAGSRGGGCAKQPLAVALICISVGTSDAGIFSCACWPSVSSEKCPLGALCLLLISLVSFGLLGCRRSLSVPGTTAHVAANTSSRRQSSPHFVAYGLFFF